MIPSGSPRRSSGSSFYDCLFPQERFERTPEQLQQVLELARPKGDEVLDLCCGPGRFAVELAKHGWSVTGVDLSAFLLEKARELEAANEGSLDGEIEWVQADMREFVRPARFDLALNMFTSFGFFESEEENLRVLRNVHETLVPGGVFVMELMGKEILARVYSPTTLSVEDDGVRLGQVHELFDDWSRVRNEWILIRDGVEKRRYFEHWLYSGKELKDLLRQAGFAELELHGSLDGQPYDHEARRLVVVARKGS